MDVFMGKSTINDCKWAVDFVVPWCILWRICPSSRWDGWRTATLNVAITFGFRSFSGEWYIQKYRLWLFSSVFLPFKIMYETYTNYQIMQNLQKSKIQVIQPKNRNKIMITIHKTVFFMQYAHVLLRHLHAETPACWNHLSKNYVSACI